MLNLVSSPGSGKTTLLTRSIGDLKDRFAICVIEGDQQTSRDAERVAATGIQVVQINTGNVGNLVCPADFDLGEEKRVVMISVTEGDDKPLRYPGIFASSDLMVVTKIDLLPYVDFDCNACIRYAKRLKPSVEMIKTSAQSGEGLSQWYDWLCAAAVPVSR